MLEPLAVERLLQILEQQEEVEDPRIRVDRGGREQRVAAARGERRASSRDRAARRRGPQQPPPRPARHRAWAGARPRGLAGGRRAPAGSQANRFAYHSRPGGSARQPAEISAASSCCGRLAQRLHGRGIRGRPRQRPRLGEYPAVLAGGPRPDAEARLVPFDRRRPRPVRVWRRDRCPWASGLGFGTRCGCGPAPAAQLRNRGGGETEADAEQEQRHERGAALSACRRRGRGSRGLRGRGLRRRARLQRIGLPQLLRRRRRRALLRARRRERQSEGDEQERRDPRRHRAASPVGARRRRRARGSRISTISTSVRTHTARSTARLLWRMYQKSYDSFSAELAQSVA